MLVFVLYIIVSALMTILSFIFYGLMAHGRHKKHREQDKKVILSFQFLPDNIKESYLLVIERRYQYIHNFVIFQLTNKAFGFASVIYSIIGIIASCINTELWVSFIVSFSSIVCVVIALYLSPNNRAGQYMNAFRILDKSICKALANLQIFNNPPNSSAFPIDIIVNEAMRAADAIIEAESTLTSDSE